MKVPTNRETVLGETPAELLHDNTDQWSGDHLIDPRFVPGILASSEPIGHGSNAFAAGMGCPPGAEIGSWVKKICGPMTS